MSIDDAKRRAEVSSGIFTDRLRHFVGNWTRDLDSDATYDFQMELMRLMVDAMRHKSDCMSLGIAAYADERFSEMSMRPLTVIMENPNKKS